MALQTDIGHRVPEGAVRLTKEEALHHQRTFIKEWPSETDVCFLLYGKHISSISNIITSGIILNYFRTYLRAGLTTSVLSFTPGVMVPGLMGFYLTDQILTDNILLMKMSCPICTQMKFGLFQFYMGMAFPALYSFSTFAGSALFTKSYPLPDINKEAKQFWKVAFRIFKEGAGRFHFVGLIQSVVVLFLPYLQNKQLLTVMGKVEEKERAAQSNFS